MQFQADLLQVPVLRPKVAETTALGAAYLAGLAVGYWKDTDELARHWSLDRQFEPQRKPEEMAELRADWNRALDRSAGWERKDKQ
jgi:glycerol kinase